MLILPLKALIDLVGSERRPVISIIQCQVSNAPILHLATPKAIIQSLSQLIIKTNVMKNEGRTLD